jgi:membrane fusion protein (multidrug efflux system)
VGVRRSRRWLKVFLPLAVLLGLAVPKLVPLVWVPAADRRIDRAMAPSRIEAAPQALRVSAVLLRPSSLPEIVSSTGTLLPDEGVELQAEVSGRITAINFAEGARVRKGDLLVKLNDADLQARHLAATRELELATRRERRSAELLGQNFVRQDEYDVALNAVRVREAEIDVILAQIAKTEIRAPFDGIAGLRYVSEGAFVTASTRIATLQNVDTLKVEFSIAERYAGRVSLGSPVLFNVAGHEDEFVGRVYAHDPRIDPATRTLLIRALCPNEDGRLLPGGFANVKLTLAEFEDALLIPSIALIPDLDGAYVFVFNAGKAEHRRVVSGIRTDNHVQILSGLLAGDIVITSGLQQLRPGSSVEVALADDVSLSKRPEAKQRAKRFADSSESAAFAASRQ